MDLALVSTVPRKSQILYDFAGVVSVIFLAAYNLFAWAEDFNAAVRSAQITILGLGIIGLGSHAIRAWGKSRTENFLERSRAENTALKEREEANKESLIHQNEELIKELREINERFQTQEFELRHERNTRRESENRLIEELRMFDNQLRDTNRLLSEERDENRELVDRVERLQLEIKKGQTENRSLIAQANSVHTQGLERVQKQIESNNSRIDEIEKDKET